MLFRDRSFLDVDTRLGEGDEDEVEVKVRLERLRWEEGDDFDHRRGPRERVDGDDMKRRWATTWTRKRHIRSASSERRA